jgi:hypothetical protein
MLTTAIDGTNEDPSLVGFRGSDLFNLAYLQGDPGAEVPGPGWDSEDSWFIDPSDFNADESGQASLGLPKVQQVDAYVAFGRLVVPLLPGTEFKLIAGDGSVPSDGAMAVVVNGGFMMGDMSEDRTRLDHGLFTGRFSIDKLGEATPRIGICDLNATVIESLFGQFADIQQSPSTGSPGRSLVWPRSRDRRSHLAQRRGPSGPIAVARANGWTARRARTHATHPKR